MQPATPGLVQAPLARNFRPVRLKALSMAAVATRQAAKATAGVLPPASPFAELLRASRFATYDPKIKQTYAAPPAYARRGNWGLKRPITKRHSTAYITLKSYEDHAQYIEWSSAEGQVRFIRRVEELNVTPSVKDDSPWAQNLGQVRNNIWLTDSEFDFVKDKEYRYVVEEHRESVPPVTPRAPVEQNLGSLGQRGPKMYGASLETPLKAPLFSPRTEPWNYRRPNIDAMSAEEFEAYLEKLRSLRPEFLKTIRHQLEKKAKTGHLKGTTLNADLDDLQLAVMNTMSNDHNTFLNDYYEQQYAARNTDPAASDPESGEAFPKDFVNPKIKPQPHRSGGLMYAHPSLLDTYFANEPRPAFYLQSFPNARFSSVKNGIPAVSFGGIVAELDRTPALGVQPLFKKDSGPSSGLVDGSVLKVRVQNFELETPPRVVGKHGQGPNGVVINETVVESVRHGERAGDNPAAPGSAAYINVAPATLGPMPILGGQSRGMPVKRPGSKGHPAYRQQHRALTWADTDKAAATMKNLANAFAPQRKPKQD